MRPYELMTILAPDVQEDELGPALDTIAGYIQGLGGELLVVNRESPWGRRRLAYSIRYAGRDVRDGFYTLWQFNAEPDRIVELERELRLNDRVIRHMVVALDAPIVVPEPPAAEPAPEAAPAQAEAAPAAPAEAQAEAAPAEAAAQVGDEAPSAAPSTAPQSEQVEQPSPEE